MLSENLESPNSEIYVLFGSDDLANLSFWAAPGSQWYGNCCHVILIPSCWRGSFSPQCGWTSYVRCCVWPCCSGWYLSWATFATVAVPVGSVSSLCSSRAISLQVSSWWRHDSETLSALLPLYDGKPPVDSSLKGPVTWSSFFHTSVWKIAPLILVVRLAGLAVSARFFFLHVSKCPL